MADPKGPFQYKYAWWDKNRPTTLPSTGLGAALKEYEAAKKKLSGSSDLTAYYAAKSALVEADKTREKAVKKCGPLHKAIKKILESAKASDEAAELIDLFQPKLEGHVDAIEKRVAALKQTLENSREWAGKTLDNIDDPNAQKEAIKVVRSESSSPVKGVSDLGIEYDQIVRGKAILKKDFPDTISRFERLLATKEEAMSVRKDYLALLREIAEALIARKK